MDNNVTVIDVLDSIAHLARRMTTLRFAISGVARSDSELRPVDFESLEALAYEIEDELHKLSERSLHTEGDAEEAN